MLSFSLIVLFAGASWAMPSSDVEYFDIEKAAEYFEQFIIDFQREYDEEEKTMRFDYFKEHLKLANKMNNQNDGSSHGITMFADYTDEEKATLHSCYHGDMRAGDDSCTDKAVSMNISDVPAALDWREKGIVSPVKDQKGCGSCWAFSSVGNVESAYAKKHNKILDLSEQQLVDCDTVSAGCGGANTVDAGLNAFLRLGGAESEADYPYKAVDQKCQFDKSKVKVKVTSCADYQSSDVKVLKAALAENGPLSVGVAANEWFSYKKGVLSCKKTAANHAVLLVGYGTEKGKDYWIIKNSWNTGFGEKGYIRISQKDDCGLHLNPVVASETA